MDFQDRFTQVFFCLLCILQLGYSRSLLWENVDVPKSSRVAGMKSHSENHFCDSGCYEKLNRKNMRGRIIGRWPELEKTDLNFENNNFFPGNSDLKTHKGNGGFGNQIKRFTEQPILVFDEEINNIWNRINLKLKVMSKVVENVIAEVGKLGKLEKLVLKASDNNINISDGKKFREKNNIIYNNRYQIDNIFIINRLLEEDNSDKMKESSEKAVNNLNKDGGIPDVTEIDLELLEQLQKNFTKMFNQQNVNVDNLNQMLKIIDFVEKYHGVVGNFKSSALRNGRTKREVENFGDGKRVYKRYKYKNGCKKVKEILRKQERGKEKKNQ